MPDDPTARLRDAAASDAAQVAAVRTGVWQAAYRGIVPDTVLDAMTGDAPGWLVACCPATTGHLTVVAEDPAGRVVGAVTAGPDRSDEQAGRVGLLHVAPDRRRRGLGGELLAAAEQRLAAAGHARAVLWTFEANRAGRRFYERTGWAEDGERGSWSIGAFEIPVMRYRRSLRV